MCQPHGNEKTTKLRKVLQVNGCQDEKLERHLKIVSSATMLPRKTLVSPSLEGLEWTAHIAQVVAKSNRMLWFLKRNCSVDLNKESLKQLCISLLCYASQLSSLQSPTSMLEVENNQRRATRFICKTLNFHTRTDFWTLTSYLLTISWNTLIYHFSLIVILNFVQFCSGHSRRGSSWFFHDIKPTKTSLFPIVTLSSYE